MDEISGNDILELFNEVKKLVSIRNQDSPSTMSTEVKSVKKEELPKFNGSYQSPIKGAWYNSGAYSPNVATDARHPKGHSGIDMRASGGTSVYPIAPGIVTFVGTDPKGGNVVNVKHDNNVRTYYAHLGTINVHKNDTVGMDTVLGTVGDSGNAAGTWPHVHFQVWINNQIANPGQFFSVPSYTNVDFKKEKKWMDGQEAVARNWKIQEHQAHRENRKAIASAKIRLLCEGCDTYLKLIKTL